MGPLVTSYRQRSEIVEDASHLSWDSDHLEDKTDHDRWVGRRMAIHEGGEPYGEGMFVMHVSRTDVNPEDDVPVLGRVVRGMGMPSLIVSSCLVRPLAVIREPMTNRENLPRIA